MIIKINKKNFPMNFSTYILHSNTFKFDYTAFDDDNNQTTNDFEFTAAKHVHQTRSLLLITPHQIISLYKLVHNHINI